MFSDYQNVIMTGDEVGEGIISCEDLNIDGVPCEIKKDGNHFLINLSIDGHFGVDGKEHYFQLSFLGKKYSFQSFISSGQVLVQDRIRTQISINMYKFEEDSFPTSSMYQILIPCEKMVFSSCMFEKFFLTLNVGNVRYSVEDFSQFGRFFLKITSSTIEQYDVFWKKAYCICSALGFLIGKYYQSERYVFSLPNERGSLKFCYECGVADKKLTQILCRYPYSSHEEMLLHDGESSFITNLFFETVVNRLFENERFLNAVLLVVESSDVPLESQIVCLYAALEGVTGIIEKQIAKKSGVLLSKEQINQIKSLVNKWKENEICPEKKTIVLNKINGLSQLPNSKKLEAPFTHLGLCLSNEEICVLEDRNCFLHGVGAFSSTKPSVTAQNSKEQQILSMWAASHILLGLVFKLVLKECGYSGYIYNCMYDCHSFYEENGSKPNKMVKI